MLHNPSSKYRPIPPVPMADRNWPDAEVTHAPIWLDSSLRDGNQALINPMTVEQKLTFFHMLVEMGFKEIEVGFPAASEIEFAFVRELIEGGHIPDDVTIQVLTQSRPELVARTIASLQGAREAIVHYYLAVDPVFREHVLGMDVDGLVENATATARQIMELTAAKPDTRWRYEFSPEMFSTTEVEVAKQVVDAVSKVFEPTPDNKLIINLPATVERSRPNQFADRVEWMHRHIERREAITLSVHVHNDRGSGIAASELAVQAGAERVEGCVFGNGERTGNVDLVTLAMNLYIDGIHPNLNLKDLPRHVETYREVTGMEIPPRQPYCGDLVFTAFSGSHQDAIKKGFDHHRASGGEWKVPYTVMDPAEIGQGYDFVRINSQSGKGGVGFVLKHGFGIEPPKGLLQEFTGGTVQQVADTSAREISGAEVWEMFQRDYVKPQGPLAYIAHREETAGNGVRMALTITRDGVTEERIGEGNGPVDACVKALGLPLQVVDFSERSLGAGSDARAICFIEMQLGENGPSTFGVGINENIAHAPLHAVFSAVNRLLRTKEKTLPRGDIGGRA